MADERPPVPAVPSVVLALGPSLREQLAWLERRFRSEVGALYPASLLRFRLLVRTEQFTLDALHALCDPLLVHPLWLGLQERGLAPGRERGPQLNVYLILSQAERRGLQLLAPLHANLRRVYAGRLEPALRLFYVGADPQTLALPEAAGPLPCFVLGPVKQLGYGISGREEPFETIRLALNALLASTAAGEVAGLLAPGEASGPAAFALGASAIAVARPQMEAWLRNTVLVRLTHACLETAATAEARLADRAQARHEVAALFGLEPNKGHDDEPDALWEKDLGRRLVGRLVRWANEVLTAWGLEVQETRLDHWRPTAHSAGDLYRHLQAVLTDVGQAREDAQAALAQDVVRLARGLRRHLHEREQEVLERWPALLARTTASGARSLARTAAIVGAAQAGLSRAHDGLTAQRLRPWWLRGERDIVTLAGILAAQMLPVRAAGERARLGFVPPSLVALRLAPLTLLLAGAGADLQRGWPGPAAGLGAGVLLTGLTMALQYALLQRETGAGMRELCRLYEEAVGGLLVAEAEGVLRRWQEAVAVSAGQLAAVESELGALEGEAIRSRDELARLSHGNTYLERQLTDPVRCARAADEVPPGTLYGEPPDGGGPAPARLLAEALQGDLPAPALGAALIETVGRVVALRSSRMIETRVEELLVAGVDRPFEPGETMDALHRRALPLWHGSEEALGPEVVLVALSREATIAFQGWLDAHGQGVRLLPTLQRDRITYLRCRRIQSPPPPGRAHPGFQLRT
ncbi:MAG TPA: hypothetical protein PLJ35_02225 [Anaerolineae bacterium]|nr:hypothetical protein [Anaerolineae bacterium]HPL26545.1 hypothetical protein [Anaerolineae bacterium]HPL26564.1 hypothetical protein [Anaerolineae bacterium]